MAPISEIERQVYTDIYQTYSGKLYGVCLRYVNDRDTAEDLLHDSFIVIFSRLDTLRDPSKLEQWMSSIVRNIAFQHLKKTQQMPETSLESIPEPIMEENTVHFTDIPLDKLLEVVDKLPEQYGNVFRLSVLEGLSHKEIGAILGIAPFFIFKPDKGQADAPQSDIQELGHTAYILSLHCRNAFHAEAGYDRKLYCGQQ